MQKVIEVSDYELERGKPMPSKLYGYILGTALQITYGDRFSLFSELSLKLGTWEAVPDISIFHKMEIDYSEDEIKVTEAPLCALRLFLRHKVCKTLLAKQNNTLAME